MIRLTWLHRGRIYLTVRNGKDGDFPTRPLKVKTEKILVSIFGFYPFLYCRYFYSDCLCLIMMEFLTWNVDSGTESPISPAKATASVKNGGNHSSKDFYLQFFFDRSSERRPPKNRPVHTGICRFCAKPKTINGSDSYMNFESHVRRLHHVLEVRYECDRSIDRLSDWMSEYFCAFAINWLIDWLE